MDQSADTALVKLLMEIGYVAVGSGMTPAAEALFQAVRAARPASDGPIIGLAVARLNSGDYAEAVRLLGQDAAKLSPPSELARAFYGLALRKAGSRTESETVLREVCENGRDAAAVALAQSLLQEPA